MNGSHTLRSQTKGGKKMASAEQLKFELLAVDRASRPIQQVQGRVKDFDRQVKRTSVQMNNMGGALTGVTKDLRKFSLGGIQQAGYQIGDYAVQVANGTSKMQAFGQQAGQFFQIFGPFGAVLGAAISVFSAFALANQRATGAAKDSKDAIEQLKSAVDAYSTSANRSSKSVDEMTQSFGAFGARIKADLEALSELRFDRALSSLTEVSNQIEDDFKTILPAINAVFDRMQEGNTEGIQDLIGHVVQLGLDAGITFQDVEDLRNSLADMKSASTIDEVLSSTDDFLTVARSLKVNMKDLPDGFEDLVEKIRLARVEAASLGAAQDSVTGSVSETNKFLEDEDALMSMIVDKSTTHEAILKRINDDKDAYLKKLSDEDIVMGQIVQKAVVIGKSGVQGGRGADPRQFTFLDEYLAQIAAGRKAKEDADEAAQAGTKKTARIIKTELSPEFLRIKDASEMIGSSFEGAMMSMVQGTMTAKDAFRSMATDIISELYRIFVVKQITGFISGAIMGSFAPKQAGTGGGGGKAIGGPVQANQSYIVGERGPEMFIPSRSGSIVSNDKMGGGGVVVQQTFNFAANGDESVKQIIAQQAPKIAKMTQQSILESRRRGGQMKAVFG
jgi:hypothetical protein